MFQVRVSIPIDDGNFSFCGIVYQQKAITIINKNLQILFAMVWQHNRQQIWIQIWEYLLNYLGFYTKFY